MKIKFRIPDGHKIEFNSSIEKQLTKSIEMQVQRAMQGEELIYVDFIPSEVPTEFIYNVSLSGFFVNLRVPIDNDTKS